MSRARQAFEQVPELQISNTIFNEITGNLLYDQPPERNLMDVIRELSIKEALLDFRSPYCDTGTRVKLLNDLEAWLLEYHIPVAVLSGPAGSGKTAVAQTFARACVTVGKLEVSSFSFSQTGSTRSNHRFVIPTILTQLHDNGAPGLSTNIDSVLQKDPFILMRRLDKQFQDLIVAPIRQFFAERPSYRGVFIIVLDGLDDCDDMTLLKEFLSDIREILTEESYHTRIKILCTTRDVPSIKAAFLSIITLYRNIALDFYDPANDIRTFITTRLQNDCRFRPDGSWNLIVDKILSRSSGNFDIASTLLGSVLRCNWDRFDLILNAASADIAGTRRSRNNGTQHKADRLGDIFLLPDVSPLEVLLSILRRKEPGKSMNVLINSGTIDFMTQILSMNGYPNIPSLLDEADALNLLEFVAYLLDRRSFLRTELPHAKRRARRLMIKLLAKVQTLPRSFYLDGVTRDSDVCSAYGGFADVFTGHYRGIRVALKRLFNNDIDTAFCREALTWRSLSHQYVLPFLGICVEEASSRTFLVSPYMENGTLKNWRQRVNPSASDIRQRILECAEGIRYLHSEGVVHGDLRGNNVVLDDDFHVRIMDFGLTRLSDATGTVTDAFSFHFTAPELFDDDMDDEQLMRVKRTEQSDVYSFACLYYEIYYSFLPFERLKGQPLVIINRVKNGKRPRRLEQPSIDDRDWELIEQCWHQVPSERPSMDDVVAIMSTL
ncbi:hypothetical protein AMATHDRAFT_5234 [Amanita thiersii Skay4041]|uniref:Protein kinase domain-containing protein n=1 Tax=Amanita thiersii Skay4041 TaxID=703135 RepID=A0A2A9NEP4_9AGAR|nr:hypothetical protein AMATHDRAFT_5234 [Amanita thiersii Skay4041]